mgnify:CR=1 FL=1
MQLINDDCLNAMAKLPDKSIDLILTDPPYGTTQCKWDSVIPFEPMWNELKRVIKDNGCIALFGSEPFSSFLRMSNIKEFKYDWYWEKSKSTNWLNVKKQPLRSIEIISIFYALQCLYLPQKEQGKTYNKGIINDQPKVYGKQISRSAKNKSGMRHPKNKIYFKTSESEGKVLHPTQKPVALLEYLIKTYTNANDKVLDFTMGSGSTGVACKNTNRDFIGIELDKDYFNIAQQRIENANNYSVQPTKAATRNTYTTEQT